MGKITTNCQLTKLAISEVVTYTSRLSLQLREKAMIGAWLTSS